MGRARYIDFRTLPAPVKVFYGITGMKILVPMSGPDFRIREYAASIRDRGTGSTKVRAGRSYSMSRELELVAGHLRDSPGCAESANP